jgi:RNA polymerase sigma-70 factor (ECF subfamily)
MNAGTNRQTMRAEFERVIDLELSSLVHTAELILRDPKPAEELVVEAVAEAYRRRGQLPAPVSSLRPELYRAMVDVVFNRFLPWTTQKTAVSIDEADRFGPCTGSAVPLPGDLDRADIDHLVREMPHPLRLIVALSLVAGFTYEDIAFVTGLHIDTVRSRMKRGRSLLHRMLCRTVHEDAAVPPGQN